MVVQDIENIDDVKLWLKRGKGVAKEIDSLKDAKAYAEERASYAKATLSKTKTSHTNDNKIAKAMAEVAEYSSKIDSQINELTHTLQDIQSIVYKVSDSQERTVLLNRYVIMLPVHECAEKLGYCQRQELRYHNNALSSVLSILKGGI